MASTLHLIAWLVCVTETDCTVCDVQAKAETADCTCCEVPAPAEATVEQEHQAWVTENVEYLCSNIHWKSAANIYRHLTVCVKILSLFLETIHANKSKNNYRANEPQVLRYVDIS